ncbi:MAG: transcription termination factor NusA [Thermodesulfobacteriota bacterium]
MGLELKKAIDQISKDKGIDRDLLVDTLEEAVRSSVQKKFDQEMDIEVNFDEDKGEMEVYQFKVVVDEVHDPVSEITLEEAKDHDPNVEIDDELGFKIKVEDLGRIAAQSAKQVIIQRMRDAEQEIIYEEYKERVGEIVSGIIQRRDRGGWIINLGRTEALLPREEQIPKERFRRGDRVQAYMIEVKKEGRGPQIIVSRSHPEYMTALFRREVPEISDGTVKIMGAARDPGRRAKVAVVSSENNVDPVGACVGVKGSRIHNIVQELRGERIDIVVWNPDIATYAVSALSPARIAQITVDDDEKSLEVVVPDDQLTPAIGRKGQNVKLASKLLGWSIDVFTESKYGELYEHKKLLRQVASTAELSTDAFISAGYEHIEQLQNAPDEELMEIAGMTAEKIDDVRAAINFLQYDNETADTDTPLETEETDKTDDQESEASDTQASSDEIEDAEPEEKDE